MADQLKQIELAAIQKNPDNPRMIFRSDEMDELLESIKQVGIKVPITVYQDGNKYVILDGERRWRCSLKLNLQTVPAIVQPKPTRLENLLMMFNIHNVRVQWDLLPTAYKMRDVKNLLEKEGKGRPVTNKMLASVTGISLAQVARCFDLLDLPKKYQDLLMKEAGKPKSEQKITPDLFVEILKSKKAIEKYMPEVFNEVDKKEYLPLMVEKYQKGTVNSVVRFRDISKIARAEEKGVDRKRIVPTLVKIAKTKDYKIENAFKDTAEENYKLRDLKTRIRGLVSLLQEIHGSDIPVDIKSDLENLSIEINKKLKKQ